MLDKSGVRDGPIWMWYYSNHNLLL